MYTVVMACYHYETIPKVCEDPSERGIERARKSWKKIESGWNEEWE